MCILSLSVIGCRNISAIKHLYKAERCIRIPVFLAFLRLTFLCDSLQQREACEGRHAYGFTPAGRQEKSPFLFMCFREVQVTMGNR